MRKHARSLCLSLLCLFILAACHQAEPARAEETIVVDGSTTVGPIAKAFAQYYMERNPDVNVTVSESGSGNGAKSLINSVCDVADMSRFMKEGEFQAAVKNGVCPTAHVVALDGIAVIVHPANPVSELTMEQVKDIYMGKVTNWKDVGGPSKPIVVVSRDTSSGTYETFEKLVMNKEKIVDDAEYVNSNGAAREKVRTTQAAVAYVGLGYTDGVKPIKINGITASQETVISGRYPIARPLYMFTDGYPKLGSHVYFFVTLYLTEDGQEIIERTGFVPITQY
jgi:phosphate transport system substrate-binding protein